MALLRKSAPAVDTVEAAHSRSNDALAWFAFVQNELIETNVALDEERDFVIAQLRDLEARLDRINKLDEQNAHRIEQLNVFLPPA